jgi:hypothetical protein
MTLHYPRRSAHLSSLVIPALVVLAVFAAAFWLGHRRAHFEDYARMEQYRTVSLVDRALVNGYAEQNRYLRGEIRALREDNAGLVEQVAR